MRLDTPVTVYLENYQPTPFVISHVDLLVSLHPTATVVTSTISCSRRHGVSGPLVLDGEELTLRSVALNGAPLGSESYVLSKTALTIQAVPDEPFMLTIVQECNPQSNTTLSGLYVSNGMYCTQMEAEGFRRFAYFYDRPDVMATYRVCIEAPKSLPVLLSNGNPLAASDVPGTDRHFSIWDDPHPKPTYLFALVGGDLASVHDRFTTRDGRQVALGIYVEKGKEDRCGWAMTSLKASMQWDEERFGLLYDLDVFNIVAVSDFNMGAMENKGLNIFNDKYILARSDTATDADFINIERIIAHEYFHNWTGNRITCRDWFQLCLKEGLTVFRDQEFTSDIRSRPVKRIEDVRTLRARQFPEDQGPLAHPVRPTSYIEINNFYTPTVYEKGAELCRMLHTLLGETGFQKAMRLYTERYDGTAATVENFIACMEATSGRDLQQFSLWYAQAGTPVLTVSTSYDHTAQTFTVDLEQETPATTNQSDKQPLHMPLAIGLVGSQGEDMPLRMASGTLNTPVLELTQKRQRFQFRGLGERPRLSINRGFTAPLVIKSDATDEDLLFLMGHDRDSFNRWEAAQSIGRRLLVKTVSNIADPVAIRIFAEALGHSLRAPSLDDAFKSLMLQMPSEAEITAAIARDVDADAVHQARENVLTGIANVLKPDLQDIISRTADGDHYAPDMEGTSRRALRYAALALLAYVDADASLAVARDDFAAARNMTAELGAVTSVLRMANDEISRMLAEFYARHRADHLLVDKWFMLQATMPRPGAAQHVSNLISHPDFRWTTPNRVFALIGGFSGANLVGFHAADGSGYRLVADAILTLNGINPQIAARMATGFRSWRQYDHVRRANAEAELQRVLGAKTLSGDVFEIISRTLKD